MNGFLRSRIGFEITFKLPFKRLDLKNRRVLRLLVGKLPCR